MQWITNDNETVVSPLDQSLTMHIDDESPMTLWPQPVIEAVLADIAAGASVERACARPGAPSRATLFRWIGSNADLAARYADAVREQVHARYVKE